MAQLKDTLIQGSARVTDTLYTDVTQTNILKPQIIEGGQMTAPLSWKDGTALPEKGSSAEYFLAIDTFASGGKTYWVSKANMIAALNIAETNKYLPLAGGTMTGGLNFANNKWNKIGDDVRMGDINSAGTLAIQGLNGNTRLLFTTYNQTTNSTGGSLTWDGSKFVTSHTVTRTGVSSNWNKGRDNALVATTSISNYSPVVSIKTTNGSWEIGAYDNANFTDDLLFSYVKDTTYNGSSAVTDAQIRFYESGGALFAGQTTVEYNPNAADSAAKGMINLTSSAPATVVKSGTYSWGINHLVPNLASGGNTCLMTGASNGTNNQGVLEFHYAGSNNVGNYVGLGLYGNNGLLKIFKDKHVEIDTLKIMNQDAVAHIIFTRTGNPNYISIPENEVLVINNGTTCGTAYASLGITKTYVYNAYGGHLGNSSYYWGNIYAKGYIYMKGTNQYPLDFFIYNKHGNQVAEMWYDCGATETVTSGAWRFRQFSPAATPAATTSGFKETYRLPTVANGLTADKNYDILTTKNTITTAQGGTGVTSHTANRLVWSTSATAIQAGYHYASTTKVAINYTSEPTTNFYVGGNAMINGANAATTTTQSGQLIVKSGTGSNAVGIELYRNSNVSWQIFNTSGNLQINNNFSGSDTTAQTTYKYKALEFNYQTLLATFGGSIYLNGTVASASTGSTATYDETRAGPKIIFNDGGQKAYLIGDRYDSSSDSKFGFTLGLVSGEGNGGAFRANGIKATSKMVVNSTFDDTYTFKVGGTSLFTGTVNLTPASGEGGELHLNASTANTTQAGIVLDQLNSTFRIFGIASADGTTKTGTGTPLVIDPYAKTITGGYTITGNLTGNVTGTVSGNAGSATKLANARTLWGQSFNGTANVSGNMTNVGPSMTLPSGQTAFSFYTSGTSAANAKFGRLGLNSTYANIDITNYVLDVGGTSRFAGKITINHTTPTYAFSVSGSEKASIEYNSTNHVLNFIVT